MKRRLRSHCAVTKHFQLDAWHARPPEQLEDRLLLATLPTGFHEANITTTLSNPTAMEMAPDGRIFVTQQGGALRVIKNGALLTTPFMTLTVDSSGERGLLGIAFDPNFTSNHFLYVYYTVPGTGGGAAHNRVSQFTANGDVVVAGSEVAILDLDNLSSATNHNGGAIHFGPDGKLYVAVGENANGANSQTLANRLGKMLRINSDGTIPTDNPFFNTATGVNRSIWALGLRNPFTFAFQPGTGRMFINDVGESTWEEINDGIAGSNYGWNVVEGPSNDPNFRPPLFAYGHGSTTSTGCAIVGAAFYNPTHQNFPSDYVGEYFYADLCNRWVRRYDPVSNTSTLYATNLPQNMVGVLVDPHGNLYYLGRGSGSTTGTLTRVFYANPLGNTNGDNIVDVEDFNNVQNNLSRTGIGVPGDTNNNGAVDIEDFNNVENNFHAQASAAAESLALPEGTASGDTNTQDSEGLFLHDEDCGCGQSDASAISPAQASSSPQQSTSALDSAIGVALAGTNVHAGAQASDPSAHAFLVNPDCGCGQSVTTAQSRSPGWTAMASQQQTNRGVFDRFSGLDQSDQLDDQLFDLLAKWHARV